MFNFIYTPLNHHFLPCRQPCLPLTSVFPLIIFNFILHKLKHMVECLLQVGNKMSVKDLVLLSFLTSRFPHGICSFVQRDIQLWEPPPSVRHRFTILKANPATDVSSCSRLIFCSCLLSWDESNPQLAGSFAYITNMCLTWRNGNHQNGLIASHDAPDVFKLGMLPNFLFRIWYKMYYNLYLRPPLDLIHCACICSLSLLLTWP